MWIEWVYLDTGGSSRAVNEIVILTPAKSAAAVSIVNQKARETDRFRFEGFE